MKMLILKHSLALLIALLLAPLAALHAAETTKPSAKPNFVVIFIDDLGYGDIGPFGATTQKTPHLDRLAREGMRLTSFYAAPLCTPSRAQLMTGRYAPRVGLPKVLFPADPIGLNPAESTVAELLKEQGYATACVGKWHLGDQPEFLPTRHGFDRYYGLPYSNDMASEADGGKTNFQAIRDPRTRPPYPPLPLLRGEQVVEAVKTPEQERLIADYTRESIQFIREHRDRPFFLYLAHNAVHVPFHPSKSYRGRTGNGPLADWVEEIDSSVGEVMAALRAEGLAENTLVLFTSDNGSPFPMFGRSQKGGSNLPLRDIKGTVYEGGLRVPTIAWWPGRIAAGSSSAELLSEMDLLPTCVALAGGRVPGDRTIDGRDIWPVLSGAPGARSPHEVFYYYKDNHVCAVRAGAWKLHVKDSNGAVKPQIELYDLDEDIGEKNNLAASRPDIVARLQKFVEAARADIGDGSPGPGCHAPGRVANPRTLIASGYQRDDYIGRLNPPPGTADNDLAWLANQPRFVTGNLQSAIEACAKKGGGTVELGAGTYVTGTIHLRDGVRLRLHRDTVLLGSPYPNHYLAEKKGAAKAPAWRGLICATNAKNFAIEGEGIIDGNVSSFDKPEEGVSVSGRPPALLQFSDCRDFVIEGVRLVGAPAEPVQTPGCQRGVIRGVTVRSGTERPLTH